MRFQGGALILGRIAGLQISIDWSWLILIYLRTQTGRWGTYQNPSWWVLDIIVFMLAVLLADIAQIAACRFVGGTVTRLQLSFLSRGGDIAPPQRPTPVLLTHLASVVMWGFLTTSSVMIAIFYNRGWFGTHHDFALFLDFQTNMFIFLALYNMLPAYPNDGGQCARAVLWYFMGPAWSLRVASTLGLVFVIALGALAIWWRSYWIGIVTALIAVSCIQGFRHASMLAKIQRTQRRQDYRCPKCGAFPPEASRTMRCPNGHTFDFFASAGICPECGIRYETAICVDCQVASPPRSWAGPVGTFPIAPPREQKHHDPMRAIIDADLRRDDQNK